MFQAKKDKSTLNSIRAKINGSAKRRKSRQPDGGRQRRDSGGQNHIRRVKEMGNLEPRGAGTPKKQKRRGQERVDLVEITAWARAELPLVLFPVPVGRRSPPLVGICRCLISVTDRGPSGKA